MNDDSLPPEPPLGGSPAEEDADFEAFFRSGEEGSYRGGPGDSVAPVYADLYENPDFDEPDEAFYERAAEREERRDRYRGYVSRFVGVLALGVLVLAAVRVREGSPPTDPRVAAAASPVASSVNALPAPVVAAEPAAEAVEVISLEQEIVAAGEEDEPVPEAPAKPPVPIALAPVASAPVAPKPTAPLAAATKPRSKPVSPPVSAPHAFTPRPVVLPGSGL